MMILKLQLIGRLVPSVDTTPIPLFIYLDKKGSKYCLIGHSEGTCALGRHKRHLDSQNTLASQQLKHLSTGMAHSHSESQGNWTFVHSGTEVLGHFI